MEINTKMGSGSYGKVDLMGRLGSGPYGKWSEPKGQFKY